MFRHRLIPVTIAAATSIAALGVVGAIPMVLIDPAAAQTAVDERPASQLSDDELVARFRSLEAMIHARPASKDERERLRQLMREDRAEMRRRRIDIGAARRGAPDEAAPQDSQQQAAPEPQPAPRQAAPEPQPAPQQATPEPQPAPQQQAAPEPRQRQRPVAEQTPPSGTQQPQTQPQPQQAAPADQNQLRRQRQQAGPQPGQAPARGDQQPAGRPGNADDIARRILSDRRPPASLSNQQLRERHQVVDRLVRDDSLDRSVRRDLRKIHQLDSAELILRGIGIVQGPAPEPRMSEADRRAERILSDRRPAERLSDDQLRDRLEATRDILGTGDVSERYEDRLRGLLHADREELRSRIALRQDEERRRAERGRYRYDDADRSDRRDLRRLLRDDRPSSELSDAALSARSEAARDALAAGNLRPDQADRLRAMLRSDRQELRARLRAERDDRRRQLRRKREAVIEIRPEVRPAPRRSIAAAEADALALERQLAAPPVRRLERRYSFEEYARRPELREVMPGIELDTIHFGFNEYQVREEEIEQLQRIGDIIERILAANPDEVFVVEGHTDAVGSDAYNLELSRKRARAVKDALLEYFVIEPENIETIGYGERYLKIPTEEEEAENRRVTVRRITPILQGRR